MTRTSPTTHHADADTVTRRRLLAGALAVSSLTAAPRGLRAAAALDRTPDPATPVPAATLAPDASPAFQAVAGTLAAEMAAPGAPGGALGVFANGREEYAAFGVTRLKGGDPITVDTLFQAGSTTKTVTGTAVMRLVEDGAIDLDATVRTYLPHLSLAREDVATRVTVRHLLTHSGGWWGDLFADTGTDDEAIAGYVDRWLPTFPQLSPLGELFSYNNAGFTLLGRLIEVVTGASYRDTVRDLVLRPLGLDGSCFAPDEVTGRQHVEGHFVEGGVARLQDPLFLPRSADPSAGLWSTVPELIRYARFHLGDGTVDGSPLMKRATLDQMRTIYQPIPPNPTLSMGMPWFIVDLPGVRLLMHDGDTFGQHAQLWLAPEHGFAIATLVNAQPVGAVAAQAALVEALTRYGLLDTGAASAASPVAAPSPAAPPPIDLDQYAGRYEVPGGAYDLEVVDGALVVTAELRRLPGQVWPALRTDIPSRLPVEMIAEDLGLVTIAGVPQTLGFVRRDDGGVGWASVSLRLIPKVVTD